VTSIARAFVDEDGALLIETEHGIGVVHDHDLDRILPAFVDESGATLDANDFEACAQALQKGAEAPLWLKLGPFNLKVESIRAAEVPARFGFVAEPAPDQPRSAAGGR
jgi:hypothetical protein